MAEQTPIQIHIPPNIQALTVPLSTWLEAHPTYECLVVGALIFAYPTKTAAPAPSALHLLLIQRAADERAFPNKWEFPGGSSELEDPTILHSVAREVFEETGLRLTRFVGLVGEGVEFLTPYRNGQPGMRRWLKLTFEIEVAEIGELGGYAHGHGEEGIRLEDVPVTVDPKEHQTFYWATEEECKDAGKFAVVSEDQRGLMLDGFRLHKEGRQVLGWGIEKTKETVKEN